MCAKQKKDEEAIFNKAIEIQSSIERAAFIKSACRDDAALLARIEGLLKVQFEDESFLKSPPGVENTLDSGPLTEGPGTRIGRYKLLQLIGEGGFGVVYMAEQEEPILRRVALKIIKLGMDTKQVIARFEAERQALAMMDHPNIARVLDAGATDTGRPYFVMELVKGIFITEYCDKNNLDTQKRLELFIDVCKAVQHAHQKGIIHRDIKPSNVMITLHDGKPVPKIIDFGIAKATQHRLTEKTVFTEYQQFIGTPEYMSPEQAEMSGLDVDTRTDIYSLGVLLYELLTDTTPFEADTLRSAPYDEIRRVIREDEPPKPSTRLSTLGDALTDIAKHRNIQPTELCKIVRGDLDWIVMKSLEKDRNRRYETANELAADIQRHLGHEPVLASPPSTIYRARKFARRHRTGVAAGLSLAASLVIGFSLAITGFVRASQEQARTSAALQQAGMNFEMARQAVDEMTAVAQEQLVNIPRAGQVRQDLLESAQTMYLKFLEDKSDDPALRKETGQAYHHLGAIQNTLGQYDKAAASFRQAIHYFELLAQEYPNVPEYALLIAVSNNSLGMALEKLGRYEQVQDAYQQASDLLQALINDFPDEAQYREAQAETYHNQGLLLNTMGQADPAWEAIENALEIREELVNQFPDNPKYRHDLASSYHNRGIVLESQIDLAHIDPLQWFPEVEQAYRQALQIQQDLVDDFPQVHKYQSQLAGIQLSLSNFLWRMVRPDEGEEILREGLPLAQKLADDFPGIPEYQITLVEMRHRLSTLLDQITYPGVPFAEDDPAMDTILKARQCYEKLVSNSPGVHAYHAGLAKTFAYLSFWSDPKYPSMLGEAIHHMRTAVQLNPMNATYRDMLVGWCATFVRNSRGFGRSLDQAEQACEQNIVMFEQLRQDIPACGYELAASLINLGNLLVEYIGRHEEAQSAYQRAEDVRLELAAQFPNLPFEQRFDNASCSVDYKVRINSVGDYRLYIRAAAYDWGSDSVRARIEELADGPGGTIADYYYCDFQDRSDCRFGVWSTPTEFENIPLDLVVDTWPISAPGDYTIRLLKREEGSAVDAFVFQLADLPAPQGYGPPESAITEDGIFLESDGRVVAEAEHFTRRIPCYEKWVIIPEEDPNASTSLCLFQNFRGQGYIQVLPDAYNTMTDIEQLTRTLQNHPEDVSALIQRGNVYWHIEQYDNALADYLEAIRLDPNHPEIRWPMSNLGDLYLRRGNYSQAEQAFRQAEKLFEDLAAQYPNVFAHQDALANNHIQLGNVLRKTGRLEEAEQAYQKGLLVYEKVIELDPNNSHYWHGRADTHSQMQQWDKAIADFSKAIELNPGNSHHWHRRADTYWDMQEWDKALADFSKAIELNPGNPDHWHRRADTYRELKQWDKAIDDYSKAIELNPGNPDHWRMRAVTYRDMKQWDKSLADFNSAIELDPNTSHPWHGRADIYWDMHQWDKALVDFSKAIEINPANSDHWHRRADTHSQMQQWDKAIADYSKAIELEPNNSGYWYGRGNAYANIQQWSQAIADYSKAIGLDPNNAYMPYMKALAHLGMSDTEGYRKRCAQMLDHFGQTENAATVHWVVWTCVLAPNAVEDLAQAIKLAEQIVESDDKNVQCLSALGAILYRAGRFDEAAKQLSELTISWEQGKELPTQTSPAYTWFFLAMAHHQLGHFDQAQQYFELAAERAEQELAGDASWNRKLTLQLLQSEARSLFGVSENNSVDGKEVESGKSK